jgi:hypothetical protein
MCSPSSVGVREENLPHGVSKREASGEIVIIAYPSA